MYDSRAKKSIIYRTSKGIKFMVTGRKMISCQCD